MNLFYTEKIEGKYYQLPEDESKHCIRVLRLKNGDTLHLTDGKGFFYRTKIIDDNAKRCLVEIRETIKKQKERENYVHIAIAPTKNIERFEWFIEKATEIGIDEITPLITQRSERKTFRHDRIDKLLISSMKQSLKAYKPKLNEFIAFNEFILKGTESVKCIAHCEPRDKIHLRQAKIENKKIIVLIGPEGDFTIDEIDAAQTNGFTEVSLSRSRLRTETAGIVACTIINNLNES